MTLWCNKTPSDINMDGSNTNLMFNKCLCYQNLHYRYIAIKYIWKILLQIFLVKTQPGL